MHATPVTIAVSADFFTAFAALPRQEQGKVMAFVAKFRENPTRTGFNYEKLYNARDKRFRSVRIDDSIRCILLKPESNNLFMLLWVDRHDDAYAWARKRRCEIDPMTGGLHIVVAEEFYEERPKAADAPAPNVWADLRSEDLTALGIAEPLHAQVRCLRSAQDLQALRDYVSPASYEALSFLEAGEALADVLELYQEGIKDAQPQAASSREDAAMIQALNNPYSRQNFFVNPEETELSEMMHAPLEKWRVFLHPSQRSIVERDWSGAARILGGAGTGKTVAALHRAKWLARNRCTGDEKIFFTTFTHNLARDLERQLTAICTPEDLSKIEITNLDDWVYKFPQRNSYEYEIVFSNKDSEKTWETAISMLPPDAAAKNFPPSFFREEWERVIQPQELMTLQDYFTASRKGRRQALSRKMRKELWPVFEEFRILLNERKQRQPADAMREARELIKSNDMRLYAHVIVDETQDMSAQALRLLRALVPEQENDLFLVGDAHQRIYGQAITLSSCGIKIIGRSKKLRINYRTTDEIRKTAIEFLQTGIADDLDGQDDDVSKDVSLMHGAIPQKTNFPSSAKAIAAMIAKIEEIAGAAPEYRRNICVTAQTNEGVQDIAARLESVGLGAYVLTRDNHDYVDNDKVRVATIHRIKGLEFDMVFMLIHESKAQIDDALRLEREKSLRYVAATRARRELFIYTF
ncbi:MAG: DEAD/DEAH box helicase [Desulfovibrio sp.]|nr:DEAD/DEAH box helicase [Desulfovibrio sp.]